MSLLEQVRAYSKIAVATEKEKQRIFAERPKIAGVFTKYLMPLVSIEPTAVERFVDENATVFYKEFIEAMVEIVEVFDIHLDFEALMKEIPETLKEIDSSIANSVFDQRSIAPFKEAMHLEIGNEYYIFTKYKQLLLTNPVAVLGLVDPIGFALLNSKLTFALFASLIGISANQKETEPTIAALSSLSLGLAEEKDAFMTSIDIMLDKDKRDDLEKALVEHRRTAEKF